MKKLTLALIVTLLTPFLVSAQTVDSTSTKAQLISALYAEVQVLEQEIQMILAAQSAVVPAPVVQKAAVNQPISKVAQQTQYTQNCINTGTANNEAQGMDANQAYTKARIDCPSPVL